MAWTQIPRDQWEPCFEYDYSEEDLRWNLDRTEAVLVLEGGLHGDDVRATLRATAEGWQELDRLWSGGGDPVEQCEAIDRWVGSHMESMEIWEEED